MLRLGLFLPALEDWFGDGWLPRWRELRALATAAETIGLDSVFVPDHLLLGDSPYWGLRDGRRRGAWEAWTALAALAEATRRVALGTFVCGTAFRNPALLAKMAATVDEISGGRLILGLGCGSHPPEYDAFGYPQDHRVGRFEEALAILAPLLREGHVDFAGRYHTARDCRLVPPGPRPGGPPIWIAGFQPRMIRLAARWGDGFVTAWHAGPDALAEPFARLDHGCRESGRDPATVARTVGAIVSLGEAPPPGMPGTALGGTVDEIAARLVAFAAVGVQHVVCMLHPREARGLEHFGRVVEAVRRLDP